MSCFSLVFEKSGLELMHLTDFMISDSASFCTDFGSTTDECRMLCETSADSVTVTLDSDYPNAVSGSRTCNMMYIKQNVKTGYHKKYFLAFFRLLE